MAQPGWRRRGLATRLREAIPTFCDQHSNVVVLFVVSEALNLIDDLPDEPFGALVAMPPQSFDEAQVSEFLSRVVLRLCDAVSIERESVPGRQLAFLYDAIPLFKQSEYGARGTEPFHTVIAPEKNAGHMTAVGVAQTLFLVVVVGEEQCRVRALGSILVQELIDRSQELSGIIGSHRTLTS